MAASEQDSAVGSDDIEYYDAVVVGTGVGESMLAAALSRVGKKVLHVDHNPYYAAEVTSKCMWCLAPHRVWTTNRTLMSRVM